MPTPRKLALSECPTWPALMDQRMAAAYLSVGVSVFRERIAPELRAVRLGAVVIYPRRDLDAWIERNARKTLEAA